MGATCVDAHEKPAGHGVHVAWPASAYVPSSHGVFADDVTSAHA